MRVWRDYDESRTVSRKIHAHRLLEGDHPARVIDRAVEAMGFTELYAACADEGNPPCDPR